MSLLPITNPQIPTERCPRLAIIGESGSGKSLFLKSFFNLSDDDSALPLHVTEFQSSLIEWIEIPSDCPAELVSCLLQNVSGIIIVSKFRDFPFNQISATASIKNILFFKTRSSLFETRQNLHHQVFLDLKSPDHLFKAQPTLNRFLEVIKINH